jgi:hypothetical protein
MPSSKVDNPPSLVGDGSKVGHESSPLVRTVSPLLVGNFPEDGKSVASSHSNQSSKASRTTSKVPSKDKEERWNQMYDKLVVYKQTHGDCLVPNRYLADKELGTWVSTQRRQHHKQSILPHRYEYLQAIGFVWVTSDPRRVPWELRYAELLQFHKENGHCMVPMANHDVRHIRYTHIYGLCSILTNLLLYIIPIHSHFMWISHTLYLILYIMFVSLWMVQWNE